MSSNNHHEYHILIISSLTYFTGPITYGTISSVLPFRNEIQSFRIPGKYILDILEHSANQDPPGAFLQVSGMCLSIFNNRDHNM